MCSNILELLRVDGSVVVNKSLVHSIGLHEAILYSELVSLYVYWENKGQLKQFPMLKNRALDGNSYYYFCTIDNLYKHTGLTKAQQTKPLKKLKQLNLIDWIIKKNHQGDSVRYFTINLNTQHLTHFLSPNATDKYTKHTTKQALELTPTIDSDGKANFSPSRKMKISFSHGQKSAPNNTKVNNTGFNNRESECVELPVATDETIKLFIDAFNNISKKPIKILTQYHKSQIQYLITTYGLDRLYEVLEIIQQNKWLCINRDITWVIHEENFCNLINGKDTLYKSINESLISKNAYFTSTYTHNWDLDELERKERLYIQQRNRSL